MITKSVLLMLDVRCTERLREWEREKFGWNLAQNVWALFVQMDTHLVNHYRLINDCLYNLSLYASS